MARLNIEDDFWIDVMKIAVKIGDVDKSIGQAVRWFKYAQQKYREEKEISEEDFFGEGFDECLIPVFAERTPHGIKCKGLQKHFAWLQKKKEAGRKGGQASSSKRKQSQAQSTKSKHFQPSISISNSLSNSNELDFKKINKKSSQSQLEESHFLEAYQAYPKKSGKGLGRERYFRIIRSPEIHRKLLMSIKAYVELLQSPGEAYRQPMNFTTFLGTENKAQPWKDYLDADVGSINLQREETQQKSELDLWMEGAASGND